MDRKRLESIIGKFSKTKVLVIGDLMLDRFVYGKINRISPEAPVPVLEVVKEDFMLGGAGNVANNINSLGGVSYVVGVIGEDLYGDGFISEMKKKSIGYDSLVKVNNRPTTVKTRLVGNNQQIVRVDREERGGYSPKVCDEVLSNFKGLISEVDSVIVSDYGKGVFSSSLLKRVIFLANKYEKPILVDPKFENFKRYKNVTCVTPNLKEAVEGMRWHEEDKNLNVEKLGRRIMKCLNSESLLITRGEDGMSLFMRDENDVVHIPTNAREVYDVSGAGDTVISTLALCLGCGGSVYESALVSNYAAGIVVGKRGTAVVNKVELVEYLRSCN